MASHLVAYEEIKEIDSKLSKENNSWCPSSERRLLQKLIQHKPAGINRQFNMSLLVMFMNNIFDYEDDINFEDYLSEKDYELLKHRRLEGKQDEKMPMVFSPSYLIRPTACQIEEKLNEYFDMELIQENESLPDGIDREALFELPMEYSPNSIAGVK